MIYLDDGHSISKKSLAFFQEHKHLIGEIESIKMTSYMNLEIIYPFKIIGDVGEIWLSGCTAGYMMGDGPHTTVQVMKELGYPYDAYQMVYGNREFVLGPPNKWKPTPPPRNCISHSAEEVLDFIKDYYAENETMPTAREIAAGCDGTSSKSMAYDRLYSLRDQGYIQIPHRKHRGIVLL